MAFDISGLFGAGAKGAMAGSVLGPVGTIGGGLLGIGLSMAPQIGRWLGGDKGNEVAVQVREMVASAAGTDDPDVASAALAENPDKAQELQVALAKLSADREEQYLKYQFERMRLDLQSEMDARATTVALAKEQHPLAYGAAVVTTILLALFCYTIVSGGNIDVDLKETLKVLTVAAVTYWVGSSRGSASKDIATRNTDAAAR